MEINLGKNLTVKIVWCLMKKRCLVLYSCSNKDLLGTPPISVRPWKHKDNEKTGFCSLTARSQLGGGTWIKIETTNERATISSMISYGEISGNRVSGSTSVITEHNVLIGS